MGLRTERERANRLKLELALERVAAASSGRLRVLHVTDLTPAERIKFGFDAAGTLRTGADDGD